MTQRPTSIADAIAQSEAIGLALLGTNVTGPCRHQGKPGYGKLSCIRRAANTRREGKPLLGSYEENFCCACRAYSLATQLTEALREVQKDIDWAKLDAAVEAEKKAKTVIETEKKSKIKSRPLG